MKLLTPRRVVVLGVSVLTAALTLVTVRLATACYERALAERSAATIAAYLSVAAPPDRGGANYDLPQLLIQARALAALLGSSRVEVYYGTAPLVRAIAPPLSPSELDRLRRVETIGWDGGAALAPLLDRESWNVVGAVRVPRPRLAPRGLEWGLPVLLLVTLALAALSALALERPTVRQRALVAYAAAALVMGCAAYIDVRLAAKRATDHWLAQTAALVQEATTHARPDAADIASIVRGGDLVPAGITGWTSKPRRRDRGAVAAVIVRVGAGRWAELRTRAQEAATGVWFICTVGLALLGPAGMWIAARAER
jgi:hypothetical protein